MKPLSWLLFAAVMQTAWCATSNDKPLLLRHPTISRTQIVFCFGNDLWRVSREGGEAVRLTTGIGMEAEPVFSPDGSQIAFTGEYDGNIDVFVMPASGGTPKRLTYHPAADRAVGWTPDGKQVVFASGRNSYAGFSRLFTIPAEGGFETQLPLDRAVEGSYSPDGARLAYVPIDQWQRAWKRYRGGQTTPIWIAKLSDSSIGGFRATIRTTSIPMWIGDTIYFLSDRNGPVTLFAYDASYARSEASGQEQRARSQIGFGGAGRDRLRAVRLPACLRSEDAKGTAPSMCGSPAICRDARAFQQDRLAMRSAAPEFRQPARAPFSQRAGEIFTVPAEKGDIRNLTNTTAVAERDPAWSPDGKVDRLFFR